MYKSIDEALTVSDQERQLLQAIGQQLAGHCSSLGLDLAAVQQSTWALAEAAAAAAPVFLGVQACIATAATDLVSSEIVSGPLLWLLLQSGLTPQHAMAADRSVKQGAHSVAKATTAALLSNPAAQAYMQQLKACGLALSTLPTAGACNNPSCTSLSGISEQECVSGKACRCSACHLAF